ncbi:MAG: helix-turn-helix domain-containing protein [Clostridia bacterium]|nr:helix-turn-helix domain-containing protein [Clostridia bacterium]
MEDAKFIGNNLKEARKAAGYTQQQVADIMLMTQQQYSRFENGVFELNYGQIIKLCKLFGVTPNDLFGFD